MKWHLINPSSTSINLKIVRICVKCFLFSLQMTLGSGTDLRTPWKNSATVGEGVSKFRNNRFRLSLYSSPLHYPTPSCAQASRSSDVRAGRRIHKLLDPITLFYRWGNGGEVTLSKVTLLVSSWVNSKTWAPCLPVWSFFYYWKKI